MRFTDVELTDADILGGLGNGDNLQRLWFTEERLAIAAWSSHRAAEVEGEIVAPSIVFVARLGMIADPQEAPPRPL
jgi:hypothetical protein